jgi:hypothetical protein
MVYVRFGRGAALLAALALLGAPVLAQDQVQMIIDRGLTDDLPYTAIYPNVLRSVDDGNAETILTVQHPDALMQCDFFSVAGAASDWTAESALSSLDVPGIEATWAPNFPGFKLSNQAVGRFSSGPTLFYEGQADSSPMGPPVSVIHAEAVDSGRTYAIECLVDRNIAAEARPMIDFIIANFSTRSDGQCCIDPADDRG